MPGVESLIVGLDLGQAMDYTALAILKRKPVLDADGKPVLDAKRRPAFRHDVVHLHRYQLGVSYPNLVREVAALVREPRVQAMGRPILAVDSTGVGRAVTDQFLEARMPVTLVPITITAGAGSTSEMWNQTATMAYRVSKIELVSAVQVGLQTGRLAINPTLALADLLQRELLNYTVKITTAAHETFSAREGTHDDLVLALALANWIGENAPPTPGASAVAGRRADLMNPRIPVARAPWGWRPGGEDASIWSKLGRGY